MRQISTPTPLHQHRRLILNALGTDVTHELLGEDFSVGHAMSFSPNVHSEVLLLPLLLFLLLSIGYARFFSKGPHSRSQVCHSIWRRQAATSPVQ